MLEPHFHKEDRISEKDLIPNGDFVSVVPDWPAPEGTVVNYLNGSTFRVYKMLDGTWRQIGGSEPGWTLVAHATDAAATSITVSGLDLATDKQYQIIVDCRNATNAGIMNARVNNDNGGNYHAWAIQGVLYHAGATETNTGSEADTVWQLSHNTGNRSHHSKIMLGYNNNTPLAVWETASIGSAGDATQSPSVNNGGGFWNKSDNISSIVFSHNSGSNCQWEVWVLKPALS